MTEARRRIRDITYGGGRWIVSLLGHPDLDGVWRGRLAFFPDGDTRSPQIEDTLTFEALEFDELAAQAAAVSPEEIRERLDRGMRERVR
jgi:hypothetical protein